jgi:tetratricopeptide (TPR) repeat protein
VAIASYGFAAVPGAMRQAAPPAAGQPTLSLPADAATESRPLEEIDGALRAWRANLAAEPADFISAVHLAELYLARVRISGDVDDAGRAADAADQALAIDGSLVAARLLRAQAAQAGHDFAGAEAGALAVLEVVPDAPEALALLGDSQLELRRYDDARATYARLAEVTDGSAVEARLAVLALDEGRLDDAAAHAGAATASARAEQQSRTAMAWYLGLEGIIAFQAGDLVAAEASWRSALAAWDGSPHAHAGLGQTLASKGDLLGARAALERAVAIRPLPEALGSLAEVQERLGDPAVAAVTRARLAELLAAP